MDQLSAMRLFVKVVERGSFSEAGRETGHLPSSVSRQIGALEAELGAALFNRTTRKLNLTESGETYYRDAVRILADLDEARQRVAQFSRTPRGLLRVNTAVVFGHRHIAPVIGDFLLAYPGIQVELTTTDQVVDLVETGTDLAVRFGRLPDSALRARRLAPHRMVICASPGYLEKAGAPLAPGDLAGHNCLAYRRQPGPVFWSVREGEGAAKIAVSGNFMSNNIEAILAAARKGLGVARVPAWMAMDDLRAGTLQRVLPGREVLSSGDDPAIYAVYPPNRHPSLKVRVFVDFLVERFAALGG